MSGMTTLRREVSYRDRCAIVADRIAFRWSAEWQRAVVQVIDSGRPVAHVAADA